LTFLAAALAVSCDSAGAEPATTEPPSSQGGSGDLRCSATHTGSFTNVTVPVGATCRLQNATVQGDVKALESSELYVSSSTVRGDIQGDGARIVQVTGGRVDGDIQIEDGTSPGQHGLAAPPVQGEFVAVHPKLEHGRGTRGQCR
jgi:hypothetical protein